MARKKKTEEQIIAEVSKLIAEETLQATDAPKKKKTKTKLMVDGHGDVHEVQEWPKVVKGSHLTVITHENGKTELEWDDEALTRDIQKALTDYENSVKVNTVKTTKRKSKNEA